MLFMVIERFHDNDMVPVYQRLRNAGRSLPAGLEYIDSWVEPNFSRCFQLMRCDDLKLWPMVQVRPVHTANHTAKLRGGARNQRTRATFRIL